MKRKAIWVFALAALAASGLPACYSLLEKPMAKARHFKPFPSKEYMAPCKYIQVENVNLAYVEAGSGPTVILIHGGFIPMSSYSSISRTFFFDWIFSSDVVLRDEGIASLILAALLGVSPFPGGLPVVAYAGVAATMLIPSPIIPPRAQTFAHLGTVATIDTWQYNFESLAKKFHVIAIDLPGFGNSSKPDIKYNIEDFTRYLTAFMDAKQIDRATLAGLDIGGMIVLDFVLTHPERVDKMVLINSEGTHNPWYNLDSTRLPVINKWIFLPLFRLNQDTKAAKINIWIPLYRHLLAKRAIRHVLHDKTQGLTRNYIAKDEGTSKEFMDHVIDYKMKYTASEEFTKEVHALHRTMVNLKRRDERIKIVQGIPTIQVPTLIVWGRENPRPPRKKLSDEAAFFNTALPNASLAVFDNSGRFPMAEEPEGFNKAVIQFLEQEASPVIPKPVEEKAVDKKESKQEKKNQEDTEKAKPEEHK